MERISAWSFVWKYLVRVGGFILAALWAVVTACGRFFRSHWQWVGTVVGGVIVLWLMGTFNPLLPSMPQFILAITNSTKRSPQPDTAQFRFVLTWLEADPSGEHTRRVEWDFAQTAGIDLVRSARIVSASGARDSWEPTMRGDAREILDDFRADLAIVGRVNSESSVNLWFVPAVGDDTLEEREPYRLTNFATLPENFREDLREQLLGTALNALAAARADPQALDPTEAGELESFVYKVEVLIKSGTITDSVALASLHEGRGNALLNLHSREPDDTAQLEAAAAALADALEVYTPDHMPREWARTQNSLGMALTSFAEPGRLEEAVATFRSVLQVPNLDRWGLDQATVRGNLAVALNRLAEAEADSTKFEEAIEQYRTALQLPTDVDFRAWIRHQLGNALTGLGTLETGTARLEEAVEAYELALRVRTLERFPFSWVRTQRNLATTLLILGEREPGTARLEQAVAVYTSVFEVQRKLNRSPRGWAETLARLGEVLQTLGERESGTARLEQAVQTYNAALDVPELPPDMAIYVRQNLKRLETMITDRAENGRTR